MSQQFQLIDADKAREQLTTEIGRRGARLMVLKLVLKTLKELEGSKLTWHLAKKLAKAHPHQKFDLDTSHSWYSLVITGEGMNSLNLNLGYKGRTDVVDYAVINEQNQAYLLDEQRIPKMKAELKDIDARVKRYNDALIEVNRAHNALGEGRYSFTDNSSLSIKDAKGRWYQE